MAKNKKALKKELRKQAVRSSMKKYKMKEQLTGIINNDYYGTTGGISHDECFKLTGHHLGETHYG
jgi:hypothetical protein